MAFATKNRGHSALDSKQSVPGVTWNRRSLHEEAMIPHGVHYSIFPDFILNANSPMMKKGKVALTFCLCSREDNVVTYHHKQVPQLHEGLWQHQTLKSIWFEPGMLV